MLLWMFIGIFHKPLLTAYFGFAYFIGRLMYSVGYVKSPNYRIIGALVLDVSFIGAFIAAMFAVFELPISHDSEAITYKLSV